jgi:PD-(D/E)XK nuclease superfamily protein
VLRFGGTLHAFDAKYRLDRFDVDEADPDDDSATYKRADLYKMHAYRDAIAGLKTAFVVYPGNEFVFFERQGFRRTRPADVAQRDGVGAVPLRPADAEPVEKLRDLLRVLLRRSWALQVSTYGGEGKHVLQEFLTEARASGSRALYSEHFEDGAALYAQVAMEGILSKRVWRDANPIIGSYQTAAPGLASWRKLWLWSRLREDHTRERYGIR